MSTAIVRCFTPTGFIVASDGLVLDAGTRGVIDDARQKIFPFGKKRTLAYSFTGAVQLGQAGNDNVVFDFVEHTGRIVESVPVGPYPTLKQYLRIVSAGIRKKLQPVMNDEKTDLAGMVSSDRWPGHHVATVYVDGYFKGYPSRARMVFHHQDRKLLDEPSVDDEEMPMPPKFHSTGSPTVADLALIDDRFMEFRTDELSSVHPIVGFSKAIDIARVYVQAMGSPTGREIDKTCDMIGGRTQIATITPADGFQWVKGYEPISR